MSEREEAAAGDAAIEQIAAEWVMRCDRGLTAVEQDALSQWLAAEERHREAYALQRWSWEELDRLAGLQASLALPNPDLFRPPRRTRARWANWVVAGLALSVAVWWWTDEPATASVVPTLLAAPCERRTLDDGSVVDCNRGAELEVAFTDRERRVRLVRGEASFDVVPDPQRPFLVSAGDLTLRVVGTHFNVKLDPHVVEVVVREGKVQMARAASGTTQPDPISLPLLQARDRAVMPHTPVAQPLVSNLTPEALETRLAWQPRMLDFTDTPLEQIIATFNRHNVVRVGLRDRRLEAVRLSATFRSDNVEGFLRLLEAEFNVAAEWRNERQVWLRQTE